jgi:hypothetical protein
MRTLLFLTFLASVLHAQGGAQEGRICTERTIKGSYGYTFSGVRPASPMPGAPIVEGRGVGIRIFDGQGNFTQVDSIKGVNTPALIDQPASGTYRINPDCTGTAFLTVPGMPGAAEFRLVVVNNGKEIFFTLVNPVGPMTLVHAVRQ